MPDVILPWVRDIFVVLDMFGGLCSGCWKQLDALESGSEDLLRGSSRGWSPSSPHYRGKTLLGALPDAPRIVRFAILAGEGGIDCC